MHNQNLKKSTLLFFSILILFSSCALFKTLHSTTFIKANDSFILGNNEHGKFSAFVTNTSNHEITIWQCPITGGKHSPIALKGLSSVKVRVDKNTSLRFDNTNAVEVAVKLKVTGDVALSMGYRN